MKKLEIFLLLTFVFVAILPKFVLADTTADLQTQIQALLQQISALQSQMAAQSGLGGSVSIQTPDSIPVPPPVFCPTLTNNLYYGKKDSDSNGDVSKLQQFLAQYTSIYPTGQITGFYGPSTENAVKTWQCRVGLLCDGSVDINGYGAFGPSSKSKMNELCNTPTPTPTPTPEPTPTPISLPTIAEITPVTASADVECENDFGAWPASLAIDNKTGTLWRNCAMPPAWIELDLGSVYSISKVSVNNAMPAEMVHEISIGLTSNPSGFSDEWKIADGFYGKWVDYEFATPQFARYVRIDTLSGNSWVGWHEIKVYGTSDVSLNTNKNQALNQMASILKSAQGILDEIVEAIKSLTN
ncbi:MAG: discoidin domain-containing protein [Patescibacteria group bacterium]